jgi:uncharacterized repeat protein (TIGR01451 family)
MAVFLALAVMVGVGIAAQAAFGPDRPTYTMAVPADHVTFNSITDNNGKNANGQLIGDERAFMKGAKPGANAFTDPVTGVVDGEEVTVEMYVHNNAASNLNLKSENATVRVALPTGSKQTQTLTGYVSATNATPQTVSDTLDITGVNNGFMELAYVPGSASYKSNKGVFPLSDSIVTTGTKIGYDSMNGVIPGCAEFSGWVTMRVKVNMPHYVIQKSARLAGDSDTMWRQSVNAKLTDTVEWRIEVVNNGSTTLDNIVVLDELPPYMTVNNGSVKLVNANYPKTAPFQEPDTAIQQKNGLYYVHVDIGSYMPNSNAFLYFSTNTVADPKISCDNQKLTNKAYATPKGYGTISSYAYVIIVNDNPCEKPSTPIYTCDALNLVVGDNRKVTATVAVTAKNGATYKTTAFNFGDGKTVETDKTSVDHTYAADGTYVIKATPSFMVDGKLVTATSDTCVKTVTFKPGQPPVTPPTTIPNTGAGSTIALFAGTMLASAAAYRLWIVRKLS